MSELKASNNYSMWQVYAKPFTDGIVPDKIVTEMLTCASLYPDTCASCRWACVRDDNIERNHIKGYARKCIIGLKKPKRMDGKDRRSDTPNCQHYKPHCALRLWREARGLSRRELAKMVGVSIETVASYEGHMRKMKLETAGKYAHALDIDAVRDLLKWNNQWGKN